MQGGQVEQPAALLAEDITAWTDGGGKVYAAQRPLTGRELVARFVLDTRPFAPEAITVQIAPVNGKSAGLLRDEHGRGSWWFRWTCTRGRSAPCT